MGTEQSSSALLYYTDLLLMHSSGMLYSGNFENPRHPALTAISNVSREHTTVRKDLYGERRDESDGRLSRGKYGCIA